MIETELAGETLNLSASKALVWPAARMVVIADPHFGKGAAFRAAGIPVPEGATAADLHRLTMLLEQTAAARLVILGDFFHAREGRCDTTLALLDDWRRRHADLHIVLTMGNHDRHAGHPPERWSIECVDEYQAGPFVFRHEPGTSDAGFVLGGHLHPAIRLSDVGGSEKASCFWFTDRFGVLPAFGRFTGTHVVPWQEQDRIYALGPDAIVSV